jgi:hypothetical protein
MGIVRTGTSAYDRELAKWDTPRNQRVKDAEGNETDVMGMGAIGHEPFPKMVYKAHRRENGKVMCMDLDAIYAIDLAVQARAEAFNRTCQLTVNSEGELLRAKDQGWCDSPDDALAYHERLQQDIAIAAAEEANRVRTMSEKAQREHAELDAATDAPVTDVPAPKRRPGRPPKVQAA